MRDALDPPRSQIIRQLDAALRHGRPVRLVTPRGSYVGVIRQVSGNSAPSAVHVGRDDREGDVVVALGDVRSVTEIRTADGVCVACGGGVLAVRFPACIEAVIEAGLVTGVVVTGPGAAEPLGVACLGCGAIQPDDHPVARLHGSENFGWDSSLAMGRSLARLLGMTWFEGAPDLDRSASLEARPLRHVVGASADGWNGR